MYWFGKRVEHQFNWQDDEAWKNINTNRKKLATTSIDEIIHLLSAFSEESFEDALPELVSESGFSVEETKKTLDLLPALLKRENLEKQQVSKKFSLVEKYKKTDNLKENQIRKPISLASRREFQAAPLIKRKKMVKV